MQKAKRRKMSANPNDNRNRPEIGADGPSLVMVTCEDCGHRLPEANLEVHRARCHIHRGEPAARPTDPGARTTIHPEEGRGGGGGGDENGGEGMAIEAVDEGVSGEYVVVPSAPEQPPPATAPLATSAGVAGEAPPPENFWACPRCTLHNPLTSHTCEACYFRNSAQPQNGMIMNGMDGLNASGMNMNGMMMNGMETNNNGNGQRMNVHVTEVDPRAVEAAGRALNIGSWTLMGGLVGGPIGMLVAGGTSAAINGIQHLQQQRIRRQQENGGAAGTGGSGPGRRPLFTVTTTSTTTTPWGGTTMSVTSNAGGQRRTMTIRDRGGRLGREMSPADRRILQMLMANAVRLGAATPENANQMSWDELLQQFGFPEDDAHARRRGATPERIEQNSTLCTLDTEKSVNGLKENKATCNICLEEFKKGDEMRELTHCSHTFHKECIDNWLGRVASCPICKHELNAQQGNNDAGSATASTHSTGVSSS